MAIVTLQPLSSSDLTIPNPVALAPLDRFDDNAFQNGYGTAKQLSIDAQTLRPAINAQNAQAEDARTKALMNVALRPAEQAAVGSELGAREAVGADQKVAAKQSTANRLDPLNQVKIAQANLTAYNDDIKESEGKLIEAQKDLDDARAKYDAMPKDTIYATQAKEELEAAEKKRDSAIKSKATHTQNADLWATKLKILTAEIAAAGSTAGRNAEIAAGAESVAADQVSQAQSDAATAAQIARDTRDANLSDVVSRARVATIQNPILQAAGQSAVAAAPFVQQVPGVDANGNPFTSTQVGGPILQAASEGAQAAVAAQALTQRAQLAVLASQIANGSFAGTSITPEQDKSIRDEAARNGVSVILPNGAKRPLADVSKDLVKAVNYKEAEPQLKDIRDTAQASEASLAALSQVNASLKGLNTGKLYALPGVQTIDKTLAQFGVGNSQKREVLDALSQRLLPLVRQPGAVSNYEQATYKAAVPGVALSPESNKVILTGLLAVGERNSQKPAFYDRLLGAMPIGEVNKIWNQYLEQNPSIVDASTANPHALSPETYGRLITATDSATVNSITRDLISKIKVEDLRRGITAAEIAAAPASEPFLSAKNKDGNLIAVPNPKYWTPLIETAAKVRAGIAPSLSPSAPLIPAGAMSAPIDSFLRPAGSAGSPFPAAADLRAR